GRDEFFEKTNRTLDTLRRVRAEKRFRFPIRLKTVIMEQNLPDVENVARFAAARGMEVFYQAVEQNYNTPEDPRWFEHSENWPKDTQKAVATVKELIRMKPEAPRIANSYEQPETMSPYFENPDSLRVATQSHAAHEGKG